VATTASLWTGHRARARVLHAFADHEPTRAGDTPDTREMIQNIYIRKVERVGGELYNVEFATIPNYKDPSKEKR
jgi:hypothetical protein